MCKRDHAIHLKDDVIGCFDAQEEALKPQPRRRSMRGRRYRLARQPFVVLLIVGEFLLMFQKGLYGADRFRVTLHASYEGPGATGTISHLQRTAILGKDVSWTSGEELVVGLPASLKLQ